jgi:hypothetical protein
VTKWLSAEWFDQTRALAADQPERPGLSGRLQWEVTGGPDGEVRYHWVLEDGRLVAGAPGPIDDPDVTVTTAWAAAVSIQRGELDPNVAFMRGAMKVTGSMGLVLSLLPEAATHQSQDLRRRILEITEF